MLLNSISGTPQFTVKIDTGEKNYGSIFTPLELVSVMLKWAGEPSISIHFCERVCDGIPIIRILLPVC